MYYTATVDTGSAFLVRSNFKYLWNSRVAPVAPLGYIFCLLDWFLSGGKAEKGRESPGLALLKGQ